MAHHEAGKSAPHGPGVDAETGGAGSGLAGSGGAAATVRARRDGRAPLGMWWVAWRQHRTTVAIAVAVMAAIAVALLVFRIVLVARMHAIGCTDLLDPMAACTANGGTSVFDEDTWRLLRAVMIGAPIVLGVFVWAPIFPREFDQRTQVFALTQSVGRIRWWAVKITAAGAPLIAGLLALGFFQQWCDAATWFTSGAAMYDGTFQVRGIMPAAFGLLALAISVTAGLFLRSVTGSLVAALVVAGAAVILIAFPLRPHLLPVTRQITPISAVQPGPGAIAAYNDAMRGSWFQASGLLDGQGQPISINAISTLCDPSMPPLPTGNTTDQQMAAYNEASNKALAQCQRDHGITRNYTDYVPASMLWPLRGIVTGICALLAALFLAAGAWRLRKLPRSVR